jgi:hypothetical protein
MKQGCDVSQTLARRLDHGAVSGLVDELRTGGSCERFRRAARSFEIAEAIFSQRVRDPSWALPRPPHIDTVCNLKVKWYRDNLCWPKSQTIERDLCGLYV